MIYCWLFMMQHHNFTFSVCISLSVPCLRVFCVECFCFTMSNLSNNGISALPVPANSCINILSRPVAVPELADDTQFCGVQQGWTMTHIPIWRPVQRGALACCPFGRVKTSIPKDDRSKLGKCVCVCVCVIIERIFVKCVNACEISRREIWTEPYSGILVLKKKSPPWHVNCSPLVGILQFGYFTHDKFYSLYTNDGF